MEELELPSRLFETGFEPVGRKRVNSYFNLRWIDLIKLALDKDDLEMLQGTQFATVLRMGGHTFSVMFAHYFLSRQLVTEKELELWWTFAGKPIRYGIEDFALVTGLNREEPSASSMHGKEKVLVRVKGNARGKGTTSNSSIWEDFFGGEDKPTPNWIMDRLILGKKYKDSVTRLRLALLVLVEGILCPTCGSTKICPEVVNKLANLDEFLKYPWGRESFLLTVKSAKPRSPLQYVQDTIAIQGFVHAMVLVTLTACPAILVKAEDGASIADDNRSSEEILESLVSRKLAVNVPWAKTVDQKGQANVRACVNSDARAAILRCGLEDEEDDKVGYMVSLIDDEYPFEHNIWTGGVKAEDVKQKKVVIEDIDGSEGNQMDEPVGKEDSRTGIDSGVDRRERLATPPSPPHVDVSRGVDSTGILRLERQVQGIKDHFDLVTDGIRKDLAAAVKAIGNLERIVKYAVEKRGFFSSEEANMDDMANLRSPFRGPSPYGLQSTNLPAEGGGHVHNREERVEPLITEDGAVEKDSSPLQNAASEIPARNSPPLVPSHTPVTSIEKLHNAASEIPAGNQPEVVPSVNLGTSPGVVTDVEKAAESIQSSSSHNGSTDDNLASIVDGEGKRDIVEEDTQVNGPVRRFSKRKRQNPNKYTPEETKKKGTNKRKAETVSVVKVVPSEKVKKVTPSAGPTTKPEAEAILLVGGFNPFIPPTLSKRTAFLKAMEETKGSERREDVAVMKLLEVFNCTGVCDPKGVDRVVQFMVIRRDKIPSSRFDFVPSCYFTELSRHFPAFDGFKDKQEFSFSTCLRELFVERPRWFVDVDFVYSPLLISKSQWVGMIVDLPNWAIYVVDSNRACPTDSRVNDVITQISILLPHLIHRYAYSNRAMDLDFAPMPVSRLDIPFLLEQPGLTAVGALLLLEFHAVGKAVSPITLTAENVQIAAENYAIETLAMIRAKSVNK
ncbi:hypothetical protein Bca4012_081947 [Brassica carinata]